MVSKPPADRCPPHPFTTIGVLCPLSKCARHPPSQPLHTHLWLSVCVRAGEQETWSGNLEGEAGIDVMPPVNILAPSPLKVPAEAALEDQPEDQSDTSLTSGALACEGEGPTPPPSTGAQQLSDPGPPASLSTPPRAPPLAHCAPPESREPLPATHLLTGLHRVLGPVLAAGVRTVHVLPGFGVSLGTEVQQIST